MADDTNDTTAGTKTEDRDELKIEVGDVVFSTRGDNVGGTVVMVGEQDEVVFRTPGGRLDFDTADNLEIASKKGGETCQDMHGRTIRVGTVVGVDWLDRTGVVTHVSGDAVIMRIFSDEDQYYTADDETYTMGANADQLKVVPYAIGNPAFLG